MMRFAKNTRMTAAANAVAASSCASFKKNSLLITLDAIFMASILFVLITLLGLSLSLITLLVLIALLGVTSTHCLKARPQAFAQPD